jgi:hypothetical protein
MSINDLIGWALLQQALIMYWHKQDLWGSHKLSSSMVTELDDNLPRFTDDRTDSVHATHELPIEAFT